MLDAAEQADSERDAEQTIDRLFAAVAHLPLATAVLRCRREGTERAGDIAVQLGVPVQDVYRANEQLHYHLKRIPRPSEQSS